MKIGIIGAGAVGTALAPHFLKAGNEVRFGVRDPNAQKVKDALAKLPTTTAALTPEVVDWCDATVLAVPGSNDNAGIKKMGEMLGPRIKGKVVIDATNPLTPYPELNVRWGQEKSGAEVLQEALAESDVYKAFNTVATSLMEAPDGSNITGEQLVMLFAGGLEKKDTAEKIVVDAGFKPGYVGPLRYARNLEAIGELWIHLGVPTPDGAHPGCCPPEFWQTLPFPAYQE